MRELSARTGDMLIVCAGTNGAVTVEDTYLAGRLSAALDGRTTDAALIAEAVAAAYPEPIDALEAQRGSQALQPSGSGPTSRSARRSRSTDASVLDAWSRATLGEAAVLEAALINVLAM